MRGGLAGSCSEATCRRRNLRRVLMGSAEIARLLGVSRQRVHQLAEQRDFPAPVGQVSGKRVWNSDEIRRWAVREGRLADDEP